MSILSDESKRDFIECIVEKGGNAEAATEAYDDLQAFLSWLMDQGLIDMAFDDTKSCVIGLRAPCINRFKRFFAAVEMLFSDVKLTRCLDDAEGGNDDERK